MTDRVLTSHLPTVASTARATILRYRFAYGAGAVGYAAGLQVINILLLRFMTDDLAIAASVAGTLLAMSRLFDAISDPLVGYISDKTRTPWGRRRPYLVAGAIILPFTVFALFNPPQISAAALAAYMLVMLAIHGLAYTLFVVPYTAVGAEILDDYHERSTLMAFRVYGGSLGLLVAASIAPWLLAAWGGGREAHGNMGLTLAIIIMICCLASGFGLAERQPKDTFKKRLSVREYIRLAFANGAFARIIVVHLVFQIGVATVVVSTAYFSRYILQVSDYWLGTFYLAKVSGNLISVPFWLWLSRSIDKPKAYMLSLAVYGILNLTWLFSGPGEAMVLVVGRMFLVGIGMGGAVMLSYSLLADLIRYDQFQTGLNREGVFSGSVTFIDKTSAAIGTAGIGFLLSAMGYIGGSSGLVTQPPSAIAAIYAGFCVVPGLAAILCIAVMRKYPLTRSVVEGASA